MNEPEISTELKPMYLEMLVLTNGIGAARKMYTSLCGMAPPCLEMHKKMSFLESIQPTLSLKHTRQCHLMACLQFGNQNIGMYGVLFFVAILVV